MAKGRIVGECGACGKVYNATTYKHGCPICFTNFYNPAAVAIERLETDGVIVCQESIEKIAKRVVELITADIPSRCLWMK